MSDTDRELRTAGRYFRTPDPWQFLLLAGVSFAVFSAVLVLVVRDAITGNRDDRPRKIGY